VTAIDGELTAFGSCTAHLSNATCAQRYVGFTFDDEQHAYYAPTTGAYVPYHPLQERPVHDVATACVNGLVKSSYGLHSLIQQQTTNTSALASAVATEAAKAARLEAELNYTRHELNVARAELSRLKLRLSSTATEGPRSVKQRRVEPTKATSSKGAAHPLRWIPPSQSPTEKTGEQRKADPALVRWYYSFFVPELLIPDPRAPPTSAARLLSVLTSEPQFSRPHTPLRQAVRVIDETSVDDDLETWRVAGVADSDNILLSIARGD
jgi:outer membrane murein-binding lipoprotein Lpp